MSHQKASSIENSKTITEKVNNLDFQEFDTLQGFCDNYGIVAENYMWYGHRSHDGSDKSPRSLIGASSLRGLNYIQVFSKQIGG